MCGCYSLLCEFVRKDLGRIEDCHREAIKAISSLFIFLASQLRQCVDRNNNLKDVYNQEISSAFNGFYTQVSGMCNKIYGKSFGGCGKDFYELNSRSELRVRYKISFIFTKEYSIVVDLEFLTQF